MDENLIIRLGLPYSAVFLLVLKLFALSLKSLPDLLNLLPDLGFASIKRLEELRLSEFPISLNFLTLLGSLLGIRVHTGLKFLTELGLFPGFEPLVGLKPS